MADSILVIIMSSMEFRVVYTRGFIQGEVDVFNKERRLGINIKAGQQFKNAIMQASKCELEKGHINQTIITTHASNVNNTMCQYKKNILAIGDHEIYHARMFSWTEYIDKLRYFDNVEWITLLKVAVDIYCGEIKGFALVPDTQEKREKMMKIYMRKLIMDTCQTVITKSLSA